ncbi:MAG: hypothetical protein JST05_10430 [Acidobacteria bacterium]|nr:hypothetical protein [Acidobacteriota bacterium]
MRRLRSIHVLAAAPLALSAQGAPQWHAQVGAVWSQPKGDLTQVSSDAGWGVMVGTQAMETPQGAMRFFVEYRRFWIHPDGGRYSLSDAGVILTGSLTGPVYGFLGASAERIHLPTRDAAIKLGGRAGLGWTMSRHFSLEAAYTTSSLDHRSINAVEGSLILTF